MSTPTPNPFPNTAASEPITPPLVGATGGTGGPGHAPSSGSIGNPGTHPPHNPSKEAMEKDRSYDPEIMEVMIGGSGGTGGIPTNVEEALNKKVTPVTAMNLLYESVSKVNTDEKYNKFLDVHAKTQFNITKAQKFIAAVGLQIGIIVNLIKKDILTENYRKNAWTQYRREKFDKYIHPNTLAVYMKVAEIDNAAEYLHLGIDRLGSLAAVIEKKGMINSKDPIKTIIDCIDNETMTNDVVYDFVKKCEAAILHHRVKKAGLDDIKLKDLLSMLVEGKSLDKKDIDKMVEMKKDNKDYCWYIDKNSDRNDSINYETNNENIKHNEPKIKDVNAEIAKMSQTVSKVLTVPPSKINLDIEKLDALINTLAALRHTFAAPKEAMNQ